MIYKLLRNPEYLDLVVDGQSHGSADDRRDGFIHFSTKDQLKGTLERHFEGEDELYLLAYNEKDLKGLKWEVSRGGAEFPHLYAPLVLDDAIEVYELDGHRIPRDLV